MSDNMIQENRARHEAGERASAAADREWLLAEVERLRAENEALRSGLAVAYQMLGAKP